MNTMMNFPPDDQGRQALLSQWGGAPPPPRPPAPRQPPVLPQQANPTALDAVQRAYSQQQFRSGNTLAPGNTFGVGQPAPLAPQPPNAAMPQRDYLLQLMRGSMGGQ
jgi:hypothetical protein